MLVIASDWHLTDRTTGMCIPAGAYDLFRERLEDMAFDASQRADGTYRPVDSFDLVLLGDIFDPLRSEQWAHEQKGQPGYARPWSDSDDPAFLHKLCQITERIIRENAESLAILRAIADGDGISLPPPTQNHQVDLRVSRDPRSSKRLPVKVRIHYMVGNHDWYYRLPGVGFDQVRQDIVNAMHLANPISPFPYEPSESRALAEVLDQHSVFGRHGDYYDAYNFSTAHGRNHASLGDVLAVELFTRIAFEMKSQLQGQLPEPFFVDLDEMGSVRPEIMIPVWIASLLERHQASPEIWKKVNDIWHDLVDQVFKLDVFDEFNTASPFEPVDAIKSLLRVFHFVSIETLTDWSQVLDKFEDFTGLITRGTRSHAQHAAQETAFLSQQARFMVYGHTHAFTIYPLRSGQRSGASFDQIYFNAGTWLPVHQICNAVSPKRGFISQKTMSYLAFYRGDERRCKQYDAWSGILDL